MKKMIFVRDAGNRKKGEIIEVMDFVAKVLKRDGHAVELKEENK